MYVEFIKNTSTLQTHKNSLPVLFPPKIFVYLYPSLNVQEVSTQSLHIFKHISQSSWIKPSAILGGVLIVLRMFCAQKMV